MCQFVGGMTEMRQTIEAKYEDGVFRPLQRPEIPDGQEVTLVVESKPSKADHLLALAAQVYAGLSDEQIDEIEKIALDRRDFFGKN